MEYRYPHFQSELLEDDASFVGGPRPGEVFPEFDLPTTDGGRTGKSGFLGRKPFLMSFASVTCPMTADASSVLRPLYEEYHDHVDFVSLYVREAHPGENYPQAQSLEEKLRHAQDYQRRDLIPWDVAVDDLEGSLHRQLDPKPNAAYLVDADGRVFARVLWSNDAVSLRDALDAIVQGRPLRNPERTGKAIPMLRAMGVMDGVLGAAGSQAKEDFRHTLPPIYGVARLSSLYRPLPPPGRSAAAMASGVLTVGLVAVVGWMLLKKISRD